MPGCVITLPKTVSPKTVSKRLDLSFCIFARRGEKYSCYLFDYPTRRDFGVPLEEIEGVMGREIQPAQRSPSEFERRYLDIEFGDVVFVDGEK